MIDRTEALQPFGVRVTCDGEGLEALPREALRELVAAHRVVVLRGLTLASEPPAFSAYCATWGELLEWDFGTVFEVAQHAEPRNYLFTSGSVPYHWDGAFAERAPHLQLFQCMAAPGEQEGGETLFCDSARVWARVPAARKAVWEGVEIVYGSAKVAHYGGEIRARLVDTHPVSGETVLRFAEPANADTVDLNTPQLSVHGLPDGEDPDAFVAEVTRAVYAEGVVYAHAWQAGDHVIADNHALLHGRRAYRASSPRRLWRVHVL